MPRHIIMPITFALFASAALTAAERGGPAPSYTEDFGAFTLGPIDGQQGWRSPNPDAVIDEDAIEGQTAVAVLDQQRDEWGLVGERFPAGYGRLDVDVLIEPGTGDSLHHIATEDPATGFLNTRIEFVGFDQSIRVRFGDFSFTDEETIGSFTPGVPARVGIEITPAGALRVYLDDALEYVGTERAAAQFGHLRAGKIGRVSVWSLIEAADASTSIAIDNIAFTPDPCPTDLNDDGGTDVVDLSLLIQRWRDHVPGGAGDLNADETIDVADLVALIGAFGPCGQ